MRLCRNFLLMCFVVPSLTAVAQTGAGTSTSAKSTGNRSAAATVNGVVIPQSKVERAFNAVVQQQLGGRMPPGMDLAAIRAQVVPNILERLIDDELLNQEVVRAKLTVSKAELRAEVERLLAAHLERTGLSREQFERQMKGRGGPSLEEMLSERSSAPELRRFMLQSRFFEKKNAAELAVSKSEIEAKYKEDLATVFTKPAVVRASHILVRSSPEDAASKRAEASKKAAAILAEAKKPGADFAVLAQNRSEGPSAPGGGDLGYFPRAGSMVEPFAAAAFAMNVGEISGVVETQFGFHIIKVTEKKEAHVIPLSDATEPITEELKAKKMDAVRKKHVKRLRKVAKIVIAGTTPKSP